MKARVLFVDDEKFNIEALERAYRKKYEVFSATSGKAALQILQEQEIDVIVSDQRMPEMTGIDLLEKSLTLQADASRILLTGYTDLDSVISSINKAKIQQYLTKPWNIQELDLSIEKAAESAYLRKELKATNHDLEKALHELKTLDQAKSQFMILINHELKTPLTAISSYLQLLQESTLDDEQKVFVKGINDGQERLDRLIQDSLLLLSAENGLLQLHSKKIPLMEVIVSVRAKLEAKMKNKKQSLQLQGASTAAVDADPRLLEMVIYRLFDNAIKFSDAGSTLSILLEEKGDGIYFKIHNPCAGIPEEKRLQILTPFYVGSDIMNHSASTGLGLSIAQALLKLHSSHLDLTNISGGVEFSFFLKK